MHILSGIDNAMRSAALIIAALSLALLGCAGVKSRGAASRPAETAGAHSPSFTESGPESDEARLPVPTARIQTGRTSPRDPFGLMPPGWPDDIQLHPASRIAFSGEFGDGGIYLVTLVPSDVATMLGIQTFHVESLSGWESLKVGEDLAVDGDSGDDALTIVAERQGAFLRIVSQKAVPGFVESLPNNAHWLSVLGPDPLVVRLYYMPLPPD